MFTEILGFELKYRLRRPATYIYFGIFFVLGLLIFLTPFVSVINSGGKVNNNAPELIFSLVAALGLILGLFIFMSIMSVPIYRDVEHKTDSFLYTYPITRGNYFFGRLVGSLIIAMLVVTGLSLGMMLGEVIKKMVTDDLKNWGPFYGWAYFNPLLINVFPNLLFLGSIYFVVPALTRRIFYAYVIAISMLVLYTVANAMLVQLDNKELAALLDPFGLIASRQLRQYWSIVEKNTLTVPFTGVLLYNRLIWGGISLVVFALGFSLFKFKVGDVGGGKFLKEGKEDFSMPLLKLPNVQLQFDFASSLKQFWALLRLELKATITNPFFLALTFALSLYLFVDALNADSAYGTSIYPVTSVMLESKNGLFAPLLLAMLIFLAGEVVWRERQLNLDQVYNALPIHRGLTFFSKLFSLMVVPIAIMFAFILVCVAMQTGKGYFNYEWGLYFTDLFVYTLPGYWALVFFTFTVQVVVNNKYVGHFMVVLYYISQIAFSQIGLEHPLWSFGSSENYIYSDMNGYGDFVVPFFSYTGHWFLIGGLMLVLAYLFYVDGTLGGWQDRLAIAQRRWRQSTGIKLVTAVLVIASLGSGYWIYYNTVTLDHFTTRVSLSKPDFV